MKKSVTEPLIVSILLFASQCHFSQTGFFYDSLNHDSCKTIQIRKRTYCECYSRANKISCYGNLINGKKESFWRIYSVGILIAEGNYRRDKKIGLWKEYYRSGNEMFIGKFRHGSMEGKWKMYRSNFNLTLYRNRKMMKLVEERTYKNGKLILRKAIQ